MSIFRKRPKEPDVIGPLFDAIEQGWTITVKRSVNDSRCVTLIAEGPENQHFTSAGVGHNLYEPFNRGKLIEVLRGLKARISAEQEP